MTVTGSNLEPGNYRLGIYLPYSDVGGPVVDVIVGPDGFFDAKFAFTQWRSGPCVRVVAAGIAPTTGGYSAKPFIVP